VLAALAAGLAEAAAPAVAKGGSPNDLGDRDPADFPRPDRALRKSYNLYGKPPTQSEDVVYRAKLSIAAVEAFYVRELGGADWDRTLRSEFGDPLGGSHVITTEWKCGKRAVKILLREIDAGVTDITLSLAAYN
jgi:hypothetical protein